MADFAVNGIGRNQRLRPPYNIMGQLRAGLNCVNRVLLPKHLKNGDLELSQHGFQCVESHILISLFQSLKSAAAQTRLPGEVTKGHVSPTLSEELSELLS